MLVVEDEVPLADAVARGLRREGMAVDVAYDGDSGLDKALGTRYDVLVLDRDLPGMSGDDVLRHLAAEGTTTRVLMLTAASSVGDRVEGLQLGADDYLVKPFAFAELVARVRALGRRATPAARNGNRERARGCEHRDRGHRHTPAGGHRRHALLSPPSQAPESDGSARARTARAAGRRPHG